MCHNEEDSSRRQAGWIRKNTQCAVETRCRGTMGYNTSLIQEKPAR